MIKNNVSNWSISSQLIVEEARKLGIDVKLVHKQKNVFYLEYKGRKVLSKNIDCGLNSSLGFKVSEDKELTYEILAHRGIPVPRSQYFDKQQDGFIDLESISLQTPVVVKPVDGAHGDGVSVNIVDNEAFQYAIKKAYTYSSQIIVQNYIHGNDNRIFVVGDEVIAVAQREPASVIGDGVHTVDFLIEQENAHPLRRAGDHTSPLSPIKKDSDTEVFLKKQGLSMDFIPELGNQIFVRGNANLSTGGKAIDFTDVVHPSIVEQAILATKELGLVVAGVDVLTTDITRPLVETGGVIIEVNATPGLRMHHFPSRGMSRNPAKAILQELFFSNRES